MFFDVLQGGNGTTRREFPKQLRSHSSFLRIGMIQNPDQRSRGLAADGPNLLPVIKSNEHGYAVAYTVPSHQFVSNEDQTQGSSNY